MLIYGTVIPIYGTVAFRKETYILFRQTAASLLRTEAQICFTVIET